MTTPEVNSSLVARPGYVTAFPMSDRLGDVLREAVVRARLTEEEYELITTAVTDESRSRHAAERAEARRQAFEAYEQANAEWVARIDRIYQEWVAGGGPAQVAELLSAARQWPGSADAVQEAEAC